MLLLNGFSHLGSSQGSGCSRSVHNADDNGEADWPQRGAPSSRLHTSPSHKHEFTTLFLLLRAIINVRIGLFLLGSQEWSFINVSSALVRLSIDHILRSVHENRMHLVTNITDFSAAQAHCEAMSLEVPDWSNCKMQTSQKDPISQIGIV